MTTMEEAFSGLGKRDALIARQKKRIANLEEALALAIKIIGHPDDGVTQFIKTVLEDS